MNIPEKTHRQRDCTDPRGTCEGCAPFAHMPLKVKLSGDAQALADARALADAQALADVRTLDEYDPTWAHGRINRRPAVIVRDGSTASKTRWFKGPTRDAARHAAAEWVRAQKEVE